MDKIINAGIVKRYRFEHNLNQWEVAIKCHIPQSRISLIENGYVQPNENELKALIELIYN